MILGKIVGKVNTNNFSFSADQDVKKFEFVQVPHKTYGFVLCQVVEVEKTDKILAKCNIIGYKDQHGFIKRVMVPFEQDTEVLRASDEFIGSIMKFEEAAKSAYVGKLEGRDIPINLDLKKLLTKHVAVLAKSGAGKSYVVGVLLEEIFEKRVPLLVIDPHGEYSKMRFKNENEKEKKLMPPFNIKPKGFPITEYGDTKVLKDVRPLKLNAHVTGSELIQLIPGKMSNNQLAVLYSALKNIPEPNFDELLMELEREESNAKWSLVSVIEYLRNLNIFSESPTPFNELIKSGNCSVINLKGINPDIQDIIVYKLCKDLFALRKQNKVPPFFLVIEEAHNYCPERSFGEKKSSKILRNIVSEGRKFGLGLCIVSQRPARVDKSVLSQCTTQIILKVTNPNDLRAVGNSVEGITSEAEKEIQNLPIGTALITGITDIPLFVSIRPRMSMHGGHAIDILDQPEKEEFFDKIKEFEEQELLPIIKPQTSIKDLQLMSEKPIKNITTTLIPSFLFKCKDKDQEFHLLVEMIDGYIVTDKEDFATKKLPVLEELEQKELNILQTAVQLKEFNTTVLIKKLGLNLDIEPELNSLVSKGYLEKEGKNKFRMSENVVFTRLSKVASFEKPEFINIKYNKKLDSEQNLDEIKDKLSKFTNVIDQNECFIVKHDVEYE
ncbi:MAG: ATP-binding protein [archaeon]